MTLALAQDKLYYNQDQLASLSKQKRRDRETGVNDGNDGVVPRPPGL